MTRYTAATKLSKESGLATLGAAGHLIRTKAGRSTGEVQFDRDPVGRVDLAVGQGRTVGHGISLSTQVVFLARPVL